MAIDNDKVAFSSQWQIDQLVDSGTTTTSLDDLATSDTVVAHGRSNVPYILAQYKADNRTYWFNPGENLQYSSANFVYMDVWIDTTNVTFHVQNFSGATRTVQIRYWILQDGI